MLDTFKLVIITVDILDHNIEVGEVSNAREDIHADDLSTGARDQNSDEAQTSQVYTFDCLKLAGQLHLL